MTTDAKRAVRLHFWLVILDVIVFVGGYGSRAYFWSVERASDATDWGTP